jgi:hypothetical protein
MNSRHQQEKMRMTNHLLPKHDEPADHKLSVEELETVAAGFGFSDIYHVVKSAVNAVLHLPISGTTGPVGGLIIHGARSLIRNL